MKIIFCGKLPNQTSGIHYCHFNHQDLKVSGAFFHDLKPLAERSEKKFFDEVERWHSSINLQGIKNSPHWWLLSATRLMSWAPAIYIPLFFNHLLHQIEQTHPEIKELFVLDAPVEAKLIAQDFFPQIRDQNDTNYELVPVENFYRNHLKPYLAYLKHYCCQKLIVKKIEPRPFLIHTMILNPDNFLKGIDHYFGNNFSQLPENQRRKISFLLTYPSNSKEVKRKILSSLEGQGFQAVFAYDALSWSDVFSTIITSIRQKFKTAKITSNLPPIEIGHKTSLVFSRIYGRKILQQKQDALMEFELIHAGRKYLAQFSPQKILFAYEERSLEHALLLANLEQSSPAKTYGFVHAVMHPGHLCYGQRSLAEATPPRPDVILTTGHAPAQWFAQKGSSLERIKIVGSPRCQLNFVPLSKIPEQKKILFLEGQNHELIEFAGWLAKNPNLLNHYSLTIRPKPYISLSEKKLGLELIQKVIPNVVEEGGNLFEQLKKYDVVFYSTSSAGIEAILAGKLAIYLKLDQYLNLNPLDSLSDPKALISCHNPEELSQNLQQIQAFSVREWNDLIQKQMNEAQMIYQPFVPEVFLN